MKVDGARVDAAGGVSHHLLWLRDGNSTEELVVAEDLLVSRDQISCRGREKWAKRKMFSKSNSFCFIFQIIPVNLLKLGIIICPKIYRYLQFHPVLGISWCLFFFPLSCFSLWKKLLKTQYKRPHTTNILIILIKKNNVNHPQSQTGFSSGQQQVDLTESLPDLVQLVHVRLPGPQRDPRQQLREHTTNRPHVHRRAVLSVSHQQLRGPVPTSRHVVRVVVTWSSWWHRNTWHKVWTGWAMRSWWRLKKTCKDV